MVRGTFTRNRRRAISGRHQIFLRSRSPSGEATSSPACKGESQSMIGRKPVILTQKLFSLKLSVMGSYGSKAVKFRRFNTLPDRMKMYTPCLIIDSTHYYHLCNIREREVCSFTCIFICT
jgi:hypothetical protein